MFLELFITDWQKEDSGTGKTTSTEDRRGAERSASRAPPPPRTPPPAAQLRLSPGVPGPRSSPHWRVDDPCPACLQRVHVRLGGGADRENGGEGGLHAFQGNGRAL